MVFKFACGSSAMNKYFIPTFKHVVICLGKRYFSEMNGFYWVLYACVCVVWLWGLLYEWLSYYHFFYTANLRDRKCRETINSNKIACDFRLLRMICTLGRYLPYICSLNEQRNCRILYGIWQIERSRKTYRMEKRRRNLK